MPYVTIGVVYFYMYLCVSTELCKKSFFAKKNEWLFSRWGTSTAKYQKMDMDTKLLFQLAEPETLSSILF